MLLLFERNANVVVVFSHYIMSTCLWTPWTAACQHALSFTISQFDKNSWPLSRWCPPIISSSVLPIYSCAKSFPASGSFSISLFLTGDQSIGASALDQSFQWIFRVDFLSVQFSRSVVSDSLWLHGLQHTRPPCPSPTPRVCSNSCPSSQWCHPTISSSVVPFSSCLQSFPASGSSPRSQFFASGGQSTGASASASVLPVNI